MQDIALEVRIEGVERKVGEVRGDDYAFPLNRKLQPIRSRSPGMITSPKIVLKTNSTVPTDVIKVIDVPGERPRTPG